MMKFTGIERRLPQMRNPGDNKTHSNTSQEGQKMTKIKLLFAPSNIFGPFGLAGLLLGGILGGLTGYFLGELLFGG